MNSYLLDKLNFTKKKLKQTCPSLFLKKGKDGDTDFELEYAGDEDSVLKFQKEYYKIVEKGNRYIEKLDNIEEKYFTAKYGPQVYNYIKIQRNKYIRDMSRGRNRIVNKNNDTPDTPDFSCEELYQNLKEEYEIYSKINDDNFNQKLKTVKTNLNVMEDEMIEMNNQTEINKRKLEYRSPITHKTIRYSNYLTIFYYFILICVFLFLYVNNILYFQENKKLYILIILFPLIYKYCFNFILYLFNVMQKYFMNKGPKNAFLNENDNLDFLDD